MKCFEMYCSAYVYILSIPRLKTMEKNPLNLEYSF